MLGRLFRMIFPYTVDHLARDILAQLAHWNDRGVDYQYVREHSEIRGEAADGNRQIIYLGNLYNRVKALSRDERREEIHAFLATGLREEDDDGDIVSLLRPRLRTPFEIGIRDLWLTRTQSDNNPERNPRIPGRTINDVLILELVADRANTVQAIHEDDLAELDLDFETALKTAFANLARKSDMGGWHEESPGNWRSVYEDDYDFARLFIAAEYAPPAPRTIVFAPSQSVVLATTATDADSLQRMCDAGADLAAEHRPLSQRLWSCENGVLTPYKPAPDDPAFEIVRTQEVREALSEAEDQKQLLQTMLSDRGEDSFVASLSAYGNDDGIRTYCTYTLDLPSYLPVCDEVFICDPDAGREGEILGKLDWADFALAVADKFSPLDGFEPGRYRLTDALSDAQRQSLGEHAVPL